MKTQQPRSIHELLIVMRENFDDYFEKGLCQLANDLWWDYIVTLDELCIMEDYLQEDPLSTIRAYWFPKGEKAPRINWLEEHIELTKPKEIYG